jgi:hypothetical protein
MPKALNPNPPVRSEKSGNDAVHRPEALKRKSN